ncbi:MAG: hypothetical protein CL938_08785 [Deltaproteobacteria bacterium]|jgi:outer membrane lipoprotein carrier protein|nr:hypothetical protein [Deltaproteobacteria bacterium]MBT38625.1 hypothetical protein [Deltaproteobacteria bacterium]
MSARSTRECRRLRVVEREVRFRAPHTLLALVLLAALPAGADENASQCAERAVEAVKQLYASVEDLSARFSQESRSVAFGGPGAVTRSQGKVVFARPDRMRWTYTEPERSLVVSDGEWMWIHEIGSGEAQKLSVAGGALSGAAIPLLLGEADIAGTFSVREEACEATRVRVVLTPLQPAAYERLRVAVDPQTGEILETQVVDLLGNETRVAFTDMRVNTSPDSALFRFDAPEGVEVIELAPPN